MKEHRYISYGGGVNSTTFLVLNETKMDEAVFVDHGADYPHTYEYVKYLQNKGFDITVIHPQVKGHGVIWNNLYDYCYAHGMMPVIHPRWCTVRFKIEPLYNYFKRPCTCFIGFDFHELNRARRSKKQHGITNNYPLIEKGITREKCKDIIKDAGLKVPEKSGCFICPFQTKSNFKKMSVRYPELLEKVIDLENSPAMKKRKYLYAANTPISTLVGWDSHKLTNWLGLNEVNKQIDSPFLEESP